MSKWVVLGWGMEVWGGGVGRWDVESSDVARGPYFEKNIRMGSSRLLFEYIPVSDDNA